MYVSVERYCFRYFNICVSRNPYAYLRTRKTVEFKFFCIHHVCKTPPVLLCYRTALKVRVS